MAKLVLHIGFLEFILQSFCASDLIGCEQLSKAVSYSANGTFSKRGECGQVKVCL